MEETHLLLNSTNYSNILSIMKFEDILYIILSLLDSATIYSLYYVSHLFKNIIQPLIPPKLFRRYYFYTTIISFLDKMEQCQYSYSKIRRNCQMEELHNIIPFYTRYECGMSLFSWVPKRDQCKLYFRYHNGRNRINALNKKEGRKRYFAQDKLHDNCSDPIFFAIVLSIMIIYSALSIHYYVLLDQQYNIAHDKYLAEIDLIKNKYNLLFNENYRICITGEFKNNLLPINMAFINNDNFTKFGKKKKCIFSKPEINYIFAKTIYNSSYEFINETYHSFFQSLFEKNDRQFTYKYLIDSFILFLNETYNNFYPEKINYIIASDIYEDRFLLFEINNNSILFRSSYGHLTCGWIVTECMTPPKVFPHIDHDKPYIMLLVSLIILWCVYLFFILRWIYESIMTDYIRHGLL